MNFALYVTTRCNMACKYCYQIDNGYNDSDAFCGRSDMTLDTWKAALDLSIRNKHHSTGFCIYGGEPLLCKDTIIKFVEYANSTTGDDHIVRYKLVTNGTLLDEDFLKFATKNKIDIALSHDGLMQDDCRVFANGSGSRDLLEEKIDLLLKYQPKAVVMLTVDPSCVTKFADSVKYLHDRGFKILLTTPRFARECPWDDDTLELLAREYSKLADLYIEWTLKNEEFYFAAFDAKIRTYINGDFSLRKICEIGDKQPSVLPDGRIYPCQQFVEEKFCIGDVFEGINPKKLIAIREYRKHTPVICEECDLKSQCRYTCCCLNYQCTGRIDDISPFQCEHERLLINNANKIAEKLYEKRSDSFLKKHYKSTLSQMTEGIVT